MFSKNGKEGEESTATGDVMEELVRQTDRQQQPSPYRDRCEHQQQWWSTSTGGSEG